MRGKILQKLFGKVDGQPAVAPNQAEPCDLPSSPVCVFCGKAVIDKWSAIEKEYRLRPQPAYEAVARMYAHTAGLWECSCTAIGSGSWMDSADVADLLLEVLRSEIQLSQPVLDHLHRFERDQSDAYAVLQELLRLQNYELGLNSFQEDSDSFLCTCLWVRRKVV